MLQPPGRATVREVFAYYNLGQFGVGIKSLYRRSKFLRLMHRNHWIRELGDEIAGKDISPRMDAMLRLRLFEESMKDGSKISELHKASLAFAALEKTDLMKAAETRAEAKWREELRIRAAEFDRQVAAKSGPGELTPEVVREIKSKVLGI